jgi:glutaredoxin
MIVELFSRPGCHLCEEAKKVLMAAAGRHAFELIERNVEDKEEWEFQFGQEIPVVLVNGRKAFKYRIPPGELERYFHRERSTEANNE